MKPIYLFLLLLFSLSKAQSQNVNFQRETVSFNFDMKPNPANHWVNISLENVVGDIEDLEVEMYTVIGTKIHPLRTQVSSAENKIVLNLTQVPDGVYLVRIKGKDFEQTKRLRVHH
jgi:hypothetical protein